MGTITDRGAFLQRETRASAELVGDQTPGAVAPTVVPTLRTRSAARGVAATT